MPASVPIDKTTDSRTVVASRTRAASPTRSRPAPTPCRRDDVADILFTSGTTGRRRARCARTGRRSASRAPGPTLGGVTADDRYLVVNPFFHSFGYKIGIVVGLLTGATLYPLATFDPDADDAADRGRSGSPCCPGRRRSTSRCSTTPGRADYDLSSLRFAVTGAAVVPVVLIERMRTVPTGWHRHRADGLRDDRGRRRHHVPRRRRGRDRRHHLRPRDRGLGDAHRSRRSDGAGELLLRGDT